MLWGRRLSVHSGFLQWWHPDTSSNALTLFNFNGHDIRVIDIDGQPWFVSADVLHALGIKQTSHGHATKNLSADERKLYQVQKRVRSQVITCESGMYKLVMRSDKPEAKAFQNWVTRVVLPAIHKHGGYVRAEENVGKDHSTPARQRILVPITIPPPAK
ncbi:BRO family protein [Sediminimonas sp.]|uniref:BRO-N domain-containing protein n=1 Tax=Sediminimonas sp. TaxID=2823379 RepID=UPI0025F44DE2|nr:BRO family protein [Sediminimonas sp.]